MDSIRIKQVAEELGITNEHALRIAKKLGFELHYGKRKTAYIYRSDAERFVKEYQPRKVKSESSVDRAAFEGFGYYYLIQLLPVELPDRIKIGYTDSLEQRLLDHRVTNPTLKLVNSWPCKRTWEYAATASITRSDCKRVGGEVFEGNVNGFIERAEAFFSLMPVKIDS